MHSFGLSISVPVSSFTASFFFDLSHSYFTSETVLSFVLQSLSRTIVQNRRQLQHLCITSIPRSSFYMQSLSSFILHVHCVSVDSVLQMCMCVCLRRCTVSCYHFSTLTFFTASILLLPLLMPLPPLLLICACISKQGRKDGGRAKLTCHFAPVNPFFRSPHSFARVQD